MADALELIGFRYSVYTRIVRIALIELGIEATYVEVDPFADRPDPRLSRHTPLGRVPVLRHGAFTLTETAAITRYLSDIAPHGLATPALPGVVARIGQVIGIIDAYGYQPMIREVFSHGFYRPVMGEAADRDKIEVGLARARPVLQALDKIAQEGLQLNGRAVGLADVHLGPMMDYFVRVPAAADLVAEFPALATYWKTASRRPSLLATDPFAHPHVPQG